MPLRILIDRSALHGDGFEKLVAANLLGAAKRTYISIGLTPILLTETMRLWERVDNRQILRRQLPILIEMPAVWFRSSAEIWERELVRNELGPATAFSAPKEIAQQKSVLRSDQGLTEVFLESARARFEEQERKTRLCAIRKEMRQAIGKQLKALRGQKLEKDGFAPFQAKMIDEIGAELIVKFYASRRHSEIARRWSRNKEKYRYFTSFVRGYLYDAFYACAELNSPIDRNAQDDYEQLCYLNDSDVMVTSDLRFMASAFEELWRPKGKQLWSIDKLVAFLSNYS